MTEVIDLTLLSGKLQEVERDVRFIRIQLEALTAVVPARLGSIEQVTNTLISEMSRGFGQVQQQLTRQEKRLDQVHVGLADLNNTVSSQSATLEAILRAVTPGV
jgi:Tfp pilus assembly protein PilN